MKSLYMGCARRGSNREEWMSTQTLGFFSRKSSGSSVYGIRWNHISFMADPCGRRSKTVICAALRGGAGASAAVSRARSFDKFGGGRSPLEHRRHLIKASDTRVHLH